MGILTMSEIKEKKLRNNKGQFVKGNQGFWLGKKRPRLKSSNASKTMFKEGSKPWNKGIEWKEMQGKNHPRWKEKDVEYHTLHKWINKTFGRPMRCSNCGDDSQETKYHWANKTGKYLKDKSDWIRLCVLCHKRFDLGRLTLGVMPL